VVAQAFVQTQRIKVGTGGFLLPYHNPAELANRAAMLDHLGQGRFLFGIAASGLDSDFALFNVDGAHGVNREMTRESLDIILRLWTEDEPFDYQGKFWSVSKTGKMHSSLGPHIKPFQKPYPPISVSGISPNSETLRLAGERGFIPMSPSLNADLMASHWLSVEESARKVGKSPSRATWRIVREVFVAPTDEEALELSLGGPMGRQFGEYFIELITNGGLLKYMKHDPSVPDADVTPEYVARHNWLVGSPETVAAKLQTTYDRLGGFGTLLTQVFDYAEMPEAWHRSMRLLADEVMPRFANVRPAEPVAVG
jgi:alkanesulfonate monooxygenase SsuD/methylene tetrahydromethanopterin reductase-like flavin-dependent oxidoreductase (luciferase family)